jgi:hypothetical protein
MWKASSRSQNASYRVPQTRAAGPQAKLSVVRIVPFSYVSVVISFPT